MCHKVLYTTSLMFQLCTDYPHGGIHTKLFATPWIKIQKGTASFSLLVDDAPTSCGDKMTALIIRTPSVLVKMHTSVEYHIWVIELPVISWCLHTVCFYYPYSCRICTTMNNNPEKYCPLGSWCPHSISEKSTALVREYHPFLLNCMELWKIIFVDKVTNNKLVPSSILPLVHRKKNWYTLSFSFDQIYSNCTK